MTFSTRTIEDYRKAKAKKEEANNEAKAKQEHLKHTSTEEAFATVNFKNPRPQKSAATKRHSNKRKLD